MQGNDSTPARSRGQWGGTSWRSWLH